MKNTNEIEKQLQRKADKYIEQKAKEMFEILGKYNYGVGGNSARILRNYHRYLWKTSIDTLKKRTQVVPCLAGKSHMVVWGDGRVASCEMLPEVGNIKEKPFKSFI